MNLKEVINFSVNDVQYSVKVSEINTETTLNYYLRNKLFLTGTKKMCMEGGCGVCVVGIEKPTNYSRNNEFLTVNSCMVSLFSCNGWKITTIEGLGGSSTKYHLFQKILSQFNGTQCGFCSPGMVMNMYGLYKTSNLRMDTVEKSFSGHICRCTGYRPILSAIKSCCEDANPSYSNNTVTDIEDLKLCQKTNAICKENDRNPYYYMLGNSTWIKVFSLEHLLKILDTFKSSSYTLVAGNTSKGVYKEITAYEIFVDISNIHEFLEYKILENCIILGANVTLTNAILYFEKISKFRKFKYLKKVAKHIELIANVSIRNIGTLAGNLMIKHKHKDFPSDIFILLESIGAQLIISYDDGKKIEMSPENFLNYNMRAKVIEKIILPKMNINQKFESYKIMPVSQNAHALVNAGFLIELDQNNIVHDARLVFGCINPHFNRALQTEDFIKGQNIFLNEIIQKAFSILNSELCPNHILPDPPPKFRKQLSVALFYKFLLSIAPKDIISEKNRSASFKLIRPISYGLQDYETNRNLYPLTEDISKIEALHQTSGEAEYIGDMPDLPEQLYGAFVLAKTKPLSIIENIDPSEALKINGVCGFFDKNDIPGENNFMPKELNFPIKEEIFCSGKVKYYNQIVGLIVAKTEELAEEAVKSVKITYKSGEKYLLTINEILQSNDEQKRITFDKIIEPKVKNKINNFIIKGQFEMSWQYHFHMETQCCNVIPKEDSIDVYPSSQWIDLSQTAIATVLNIPSNRVNIFIRRLGGGFGAKLCRNSMIACASSIAAFKLKKPVKITMDFQTNMNVVGKRYPILSQYEASMDDDGLIKYLKNHIYSDYGCGGNEPNLPYLLDSILSNYNTESWQIKTFSVNTDTSANCYIRGPGSCEGLAIIESIMDHLAISINMDPLEFRIKNIENKEIKKYIEDLRQWADIDERKLYIAEFNKNNNWIKRGLAVVPMIYKFHLFGNYGVIVSIYHVDGSVSIAHGGVEMGQGINTKVIQVCAHKLQIPIDKITVKPSNNLIAPNSHMSGGSLTSEGVCCGIIKACDIILNRLDPIRKENPQISWEKLIKIAHGKFINLSATSMSTPIEPNLKNYDVYGVCATEIELDILTGQYIIKRVDLLEDVGNSLSPKIDIGQVEGAFVMGIGYFTTEQIILNDDGKLLTNRTWNYKPPGANDIPIDFRVKFPKNNPNNVGVLKSKATAEPPICLAVSVPLAIRNAVGSFRKQGGHEIWYPFNGPSTVENTFLNCLHNFEDYYL